MVALCAQAGEPLSHELREFAAGVACHAAESADPAPPLPRLAARALGSLGRAESARRVLLLGTEAVRPASWRAAGNGAGWSLDLRRLVTRSGDRLELLFFAGLDLIVAALGPLWDADRGHGLLALRRTAETGRLLLGPMAAPARQAALRQEMRRCCEARLEQLAARRGWSSRPLVVLADPELR